MIRYVLAVLIASNSVNADPVDDVVAAARQAFAEMPRVVLVDQIAGHCGADDDVNEAVAYCTTTQQILLARAASTTPQAPYYVAHAFGHAVQVRHGIADFALKQIRARRNEEAMLRGLVERQVDCIAGFLLNRAGYNDINLADLFETDPFPDIHWGRNPLSAGPVISVDLKDRAEWFDIGQNGDIAACAPGEFSSVLLVSALRP